MHDIATTEINVTAYRIKQIATRPSNKLQISMKAYSCEVLNTILHNHDKILHQSNLPLGI